MSKIIVDIRDGISVKNAISCVEDVVARGKVVSYNKVKHYGWITLFTQKDDKGDIIQVVTRTKRKGQKSDSFVVCRNIPKNC